MPSKSQKQHDLMNIAAHDKEFAEKNGIDQEVAKEFIKRDKEEGLYQEEDSSESDTSRFNDRFND